MTATTEASPLPPKRRLSNAQRQVVSDLALTATLCVSAIATWQALVSFGIVSRLVLPLPSSIPASLASLIDSGALLDNLLTTLAEAAAGFTIATGIGLALGALIAEFRVVERIVYPYLIALQTMPKIALAPLLLVWFGFGLGSKIAVAAVISLFPILVNTIAGLKSCEPGRLDVLRALGAGRWDCFRLVKLPNALPFVFAGLSTAVMFALTGALVGEFVGSTQGLGYLIVQANNLMDIPGVFAVLAVLCVVGTAIFGAMQFARRKVLYWAPNEE
ncbi:MAG: ABC transporter permease [Alphaproteobacteria bacterium]|nr:ABC transporter permease [Alphaproteobacteria bacterium]MBV8406855.1 ABC transporter permease [Alphaproteobacteria bacterium]